MANEIKLDPRLLAEFIKLNKNILDAPNLAQSLEEIDLEVTPHEVVYSEGKIRLLHFSPLAQKQINRHEGFDDYVNGYMDNCIDFVRKESASDKISLQGYCTGGTLSTVYSALHPDKIKNLILTAPVIDGRRDSTVVSNLAKHMDVDKLVDTLGNMPPELMYYVFSILKPFEQGFEKYLNFFKNIHDKEYVENFIRVEKWISDTPPIPGELFRQWIKDVYQENLLINNNMYVAGRRVSLKNITMPLLTQVAVGDHLVSPECSMPIHYAVSSEDKTLKIYPTGHVGMIASSFSQKKVLPEFAQWLTERSEK